MAPKAPRDIKYNSLLKNLAKHFTSDTRTIDVTYRFYNWIIISGHSIKSYIAELKDVSRLCLFGKTEEGTELTPHFIL